MSNTATTNDNSLQRDLKASYKGAYTDFCGTGGPCIYKTGPRWPILADRPGYHSDYQLIRVARPVYGHKIASIWLETLREIVALLDSLDPPVRWTTIDPLAYANAGEADLICDFVIIISVEPDLLAFEHAKAAAEAVSAIISAAGLPEIQVAIAESVYQRQGKLMGFDDLLWDSLRGVVELRKPFTPTLGLSITPHKTPQVQGTGGAFFRLSSDDSDERIALLTCSHVVHPTLELDNKPYTHESDAQEREDILLLADESFAQSVNAIGGFMRNESTTLGSWERLLSRLPPNTTEDTLIVADRRKRGTYEMEKAHRNIKAAEELLVEVAAKNYSSTDTRILGSVLHCSQIGVDEDGYLSDWAFVLLDSDKLDEKTFKGNRLLVGNLGEPNTLGEWLRHMYPQKHDSHWSHDFEDMLLQVRGSVPRDEFLDPQNYDSYNAQALVAVKNGCASATTYGRVNGLESMTRQYLDDECTIDALEFVVCNYDTKKDQHRYLRFSDKGDSGSLVVDRTGRAIGLLTGGGGAFGRVNQTYITPFFALKKQIARVYKDAHLLPPVTQT